MKSMKSMRIFHLEFIEYCLSEQGYSQYYEIYTYFVQFYFPIFYSEIRIILKHHNLNLKMSISSSLGYAPSLVIHHKM